jgi:hypothetical protein
MSQVSRHTAVDALGLLLTVLVTAASVQDRSGTTPYSDQLDTITCRLTIWPFIKGLQVIYALSQ